MSYRMCAAQANRRRYQVKGYTASLASGEAILYMDRKRWLWMLSVLYPLQPFLGMWLHYVTGVEAWLHSSTTIG